MSEGSVHGLAHLLALWLGVVLVVGPVVVWRLVIGRWLDDSGESSETLQEHGYGWAGAVALAGVSWLVLALCYEVGRMVLEGAWGVL